MEYMIADNVKYGNETISHTIRRNRLGESAGELDPPHAEAADPVAFFLPTRKVALVIYKRDYSKVNSS